MSPPVTRSGQGISKPGCPDSQNEENVVILSVDNIGGGRGPTESATRRRNAFVSRHMILTTRLLHLHFYPTLVANLHTPSRSFCQGSLLRCLTTYLRYFLACQEGRSGQGNIPEQTRSELGMRGNHALIEQDTHTVI